MGSASTERPDIAAGYPPINAAGWTRVALRSGGLLLALLVYLPLHGVWRLLRLSSPWPRSFLGTAAWICGARRYSTGVLLRRNVVFVANHTSSLDVPILAGANGSAFVAKAELRGAPLVGWLSTLNHTIFVSRSDRLGVAEQINRVRTAIAQSWAVTIFPEGTTSGPRELLPFNGSLLAVLEPPPPGVLVQPVFVDYGAAGDDVSWVGDEPGKDNALRIMARRSGFGVTVNFLDPFDPRDFPGRKGIAAEARRRIAEAMGIEGGVSG